MDFKLLIRRFFAFVIDWNIMFGVAVALMFYCPWSNPEYLLYPSIKMLTSAGFLLGLIWLPLYCLFKDCLFGRRSLGKLICGLMIQDSETGGKASFGRLILRNVTYVIVQIEGIVVLVSDIEKPSNNALSSIKFQQIRTPDQTITVTEFFKTIIEEGLHLEYDESKLQKALNDVLETDKYSDQKIDFPATFLPKRKFLPVPRCSKCHNIMLLTEENGRLKYVCSNVSCDECYEAVIN